MLCKSGIIELLSLQCIDMSESPKRRTVNKALRLLLGLAFIFFALIILLLILQLTESALSIWQMLEQMSPVLLIVYVIGLCFVSLLIVATIWLLLNARTKPAYEAAKEHLIPATRDDLEQALRKADEQGVDTADARQEVSELGKRVAQAMPYVVFFGAVSAGKSALLRAITGEGRIDVDPRAGTTREITHYRFSDGRVADLYLTDAPGILDMDEHNAQLAREEARRADLVVYVCDGELTRDQCVEALELQSLERPMLLALNKTDRYSEADLAAIIGRLATQLPGVEIIPVQAGGKESVIRLDAQGRETALLRERAPQIEPLMAAIHKRVDSETDLLHKKRDESLVRLGFEKLDRATQAHRKRQCDELVKGYARKAMLGAMAAVSPGSDVLIQGYLGVQMVRELSQLYEVKIGQTDLDRFIALASQQVGKRLTLLLALAGNVLKAFPGVGTVTGGLLHAVAYGMIFEGLGNAVAKTLQENGELYSAQALDYFEETISGDLEGRAKHFARLAWQEFVAK
jgi:small GTP-binding protein